MLPPTQAQDPEPAGLFAGKLINHSPKGDAFSATERQPQECGPFCMGSFLKPGTDKSCHNFNPDGENGCWLIIGAPDVH